MHLAKHLLEHDDIDCLVRGEHLAAAAGGVAPIDAWVELWVLNEADADEAQAVITQMITDDSDETDEAWICPMCIEWREGQYSHCWKCGAERLS